MKKIVLIAAALFALAACSKETLQQPIPKGDNEIVFAVSANANVSVSSKATETVIGNLDTIYVSAHSGLTSTDLNTDNGNVFNNVGFYKRAGQTADLYVGGKYWHVNGSNLKIDSKLTFFAYAPSAAEMGGVTVTFDNTTPATPVRKIEGYVPAADIANQKDVVVGSVATEQGDGSSTTASNVALNLNHALSQIEIQAKNSSAIQYKIAGVKIGGFSNKGNLTVAGDGTSTWAAASDATQNAVYSSEYATAVDMGANETSVMGANGNAMIIPQNFNATTKKVWDATHPSTGGAYLALKINAKDSKGNLLFPKNATPNNDDFGWVAIALHLDDTDNDGVGDAFEFEAGKKYTFILDFTDGAGYVAPGCTYGSKNEGDLVIGAMSLNVTVAGWGTSENKNFQAE